MAPQVLVVGSVNVDLVVRVPALPRPGETVTGGTFARGPGGKGGNQATAAARLGAEVVMIGAVGADEFGESARRDLEASGVDVSCLRTVDAPTGIAQITVDERGENCIAVAPGANRELAPDDVRAAITRCARPGATVLANLEIAEPAIAAAAECARAGGCRFLLNPAPARPLPPALLAAVDVLTPNEHEASGLGAPGVPGLLEHGVGAVVVTRGARGYELHRRGHACTMGAAFPAEVVDTTGAGDAFSGTLAWALAGGLPLEAAARLAAAAGALATRAHGARAGYATRGEVEALAR